MREEIWNNIPQREHQCVQVYPFDKEGHDLMVHGTIEFKHHDGHEKGTEWAARYKLVKENGELKMVLARIFFVGIDGRLEVWCADACIQDTADQRSDK